MATKVALIAAVIFLVLAGVWLLKQPVAAEREQRPPPPANNPSEKKPIYRTDSFVEAVVYTAVGIGTWGYYGFPHFMVVTLGCTAFGCAIAFLWKRDML